MSTLQPPENYSTQDTTQSDPDNNPDNNPDNSPDNSPDNNNPEQSDESQKQRQQQFILKFCWQLAKVVEACKHNQTAEIEVGRRRSGNKQIRVKLLAERDTQLSTSKAESKDGG